MSTITLVVGLLALGTFVLWIVALVSIARRGASGTVIALWILIVTLLPLLGSILWFTIGRNSAGRVAQDS